MFSLPKKGLELDKVTVREIDQSLDKAFVLEINKNGTSKPTIKFQENDDIVKKCLAFKESNNISNKKWRALKNLLKEFGIDGFPSLFQLKKISISLDQIFEIKTNTFGIYNRVETKLKYHLEEIVNRLAIPCDVPLRIKFCGDGSQLFRANFNFNFGFSCINDSESCKGLNGHSMIGIFEIDHENYENLSGCLKNVVHEINEMKPLRSHDNTSPIRSFEINNKDYPVIFFLGGDLKFLALFMGIQSAKSNHPCIYCKAHVEEFGDSTKDFSIIDTSKKARTLEDSKKTLEFNRPGTYGYAASPLSQFIPFCHVIPDVLHLKARVCQKLNKLLIDEIILQDNSYALDWNKRPTLKRYADFLQIECKILNPFYICSQTNEFKIRDLNGKQLEILFSKIKLSAIFSGNGQISERIDKIEKIWTDFYIIYCLIKSPINRTIHENMSFIEKNRIEFIKNEPILTPKLLKTKTHEWLMLYRSVYHAKDVTPYMHILVSHFHQLWELHGDINLFNQEGFEKKNDQLRTIYFSATNRDQDFKMQMMKKINRIEHFQMERDIDDETENDQDEDD